MASTTGTPTAQAKAWQAEAAQRLALVDQLYRSGKPAEAEALCREIVARNPEHPAALNAMAVLLGRRGVHSEAEQFARHAVGILPRDGALRLNLGNLLFARGDNAGAEAQYRKAIEFNSQSADAYYNLGLALREQERFDEALAAQRRATAINPVYPPALVQTAANLMSKDAHADALAPLDAAIKADPRYFDAQYYCGTCLTVLGRHEEAIESYRRAIAIRPEKHEAHYALANALAAIGQDQAALEEYQATIRAAPDFVPAHYDHLALAWTLGRDVGAFETFAYARSKVGMNLDLSLAEAEFRLRFRQADAAEALLRPARDAAPERADIAAALARALADQGRYADGIELYQRAVALEPHSIRHRHGLAVVQVFDGKLADARRVLEDALAMAPLDQTTLGYLTLVYRELGDSAFNTIFDVNRYVREYDLPVPEGFTDVNAFNLALREELERMHTRQVQPLDQTLQNGTQTPGALFDKGTRCIGLLQERIREAVADYIAGMPDDASHPFLRQKSSDFSFAGSWSCRLQSTGYHTNHLHSQGWISSAYYVSLPDSVRDRSNTEGHLKFGETKFKISESDRPSLIVGPQVGKLVLFPSYFWHGTVPFSSDDVRLTVAFDVVPGKAKPAPPGWKNY